MSACNDTPLSVTSIDSPTEVASRHETASSQSTLTSIPSYTPSATTTSTLTPIYNVVPSSTPTLIPTNDASPTPKPEPIAKVPILFWNILWGGGITPDCNQAGSIDKGFDEIEKVLIEASPDILGLAEICGWNVPLAQFGGQTTADYMANQLSMDFAIAEDFIDGVTLTTAIYSKYPIVEFESLRYDFSNTGRLLSNQNDPAYLGGKLFRGLRARVLLSNDIHMNIFIVHLTPDSSPVGVEIKTDQALWLLELMEPYFDEYTIFMGDMNFSLRSDTANMLRNANWVAIDERGIARRWADPEKYMWTVDQIWLPNNGLVRFTPMSQDGDYFLHLRDFSYILYDIEVGSDHSPEASVISLYER